MALGPFPKEVLDAYNETSSEEENDDFGDSDNYNQAPQTKKGSRKKKTTTKSKGRKHEQRKSPPEQLIPARTEPNLDELAAAFGSRALGNADKRFRAEGLRKLMSQLCPNDDCDMINLSPFVVNEVLIDAARRFYEPLHSFVHGNKPKFAQRKVSDFAKDSVALLGIIHTQNCEKREQCKLCDSKLLKDMTPKSTRGAKQKVEPFMELYALCMKLAKDKLTQDNAKAEKESKISLAKGKDVANFCYDPEKVSDTYRNICISLI